MRSDSARFQQLAIRPEIPQRIEIAVGVEQIQPRMTFTAGSVEERNRGFAISAYRGDPSGPEPRRAEHEWTWVTDEAGSDAVRLVATSKARCHHARTADVLNGCRFLSGEAHIEIARLGRPAEVIEHPRKPEAVGRSVP